MKSVSHLRAIFYAASGFTVWVLCDTGAKLGADMGVSTFLMLASYGFVGMAVLALYAAPRGEIRKLWPRAPRRQLGRAIIATGSTLVNIVAVKYMPLTMFYIVVFTAPMAVALMASLFLRERLTPIKVLMIVAGFVGVVIAINPAGPLQGQWIGYAAVGCGVVLYASNAVWLRRLTQNESMQSIAFLGALIMAIAGTVACCLAPPGMLPLKAVPLLLGMGVCCIFGNVLNFLALKYTTAATVSQFHYTQIITGSIMGYLLWHEVPTWHFLTGAVIIVASGCFIAAQARKTGVLAPAP